jgi:hypothetical protein
MQLFEAKKSALKSSRNALFLTGTQAAIYLKLEDMFAKRNEAVTMKKILSLLTGITLVLTFGLAYAEDSVTDTKNTNEKVIRNDDLLHIKLDPDRATVNQMLSESIAEGSAAGGVSNESENIDDIDFGQGETPPIINGSVRMWH